jgi:hypothetical protein
MMALHPNIEVDRGSRFVCSAPTNNTYIRSFCHGNAELQVCMGNVFLAIIKPRLFHQSLSNRRKGPVTTQKKIRLTCNLIFATRKINKYFKYAQKARGCPLFVHLCDFCDTCDSCDCIPALCRLIHVVKQNFMLNRLNFPKKKPK